MTEPGFNPGGGSLPLCSKPPSHAVHRHRHGHHGVGGGEELAFTELLPAAQKHQVPLVPRVSVFNFYDSLYPPCKGTRKLRLREARQFSEGQTGTTSRAGHKPKPATPGGKLDLEPERSRGGDTPPPTPAPGCSGVLRQCQEWDFRRGSGTSTGMSRSSQRWRCCLGFALVANPCVLLTEANLDYNEGLD